MPIQSLEEATQEFRKALNEDYYSKDRSTNSAEDYSKEKEKRDLNASVEFAHSVEFQTLFEGAVGE